MDTRYKVSVISVICIWWSFQIFFSFVKCVEHFLLNNFHFRREVFDTTRLLSFTHILYVTDRVQNRLWDV